MKDFFKRADVIIFCGILLLAALLFLPSLLRESGTVAEVRLQGDVIDRVDLSRLEGEDVRTYPTASGDIVLSFSRDGVRVLHSPCLGQDCVKTGNIRKSGDAILCAPLAFSVCMEGKAETDGITG